MKPATVDPLTVVLGRFVAEFRLDDLRDRDELSARVRWHVLDAVGVALASWTLEDRFAAKLRAGVATETGPSTVIGCAEGATPAVAALMNASLIQGANFDDVEHLTVMHCESFATAAALAVGESAERPGAALVEAWVVAAEVALRMAAGVVGDGGLFPTGFHNTAVFGTFGAAVAAAKLLRLSAEQTANALALAVSFASGTSVGWLDGSGRNLPIQVGWAAHAGVVAAALAASGCTCSLTTIDAPRGLYESHAWRHGWSRQEVLAGLGEDWRASRISIKTFPCGAMVQASAECARELVAAHDLKPHEVISGEIVVPGQLRDVIEAMGPSLYRPPSGFASIGAFPCIVARIIIEGDFRLEHLSDAAVADAAMLSLAQRLRVSFDDRHLDRAIDQRPSVVTLETRRGVLTGTVTCDAGHYGRLESEVVASKFRDNACRLLTHQHVREIEDAVSRLEALERLDELTTLLRAVIPERGRGTSR